MKYGGAAASASGNYVQPKDVCEKILMRRAWTRDTQLVKGPPIPDAAIRLYPITSPSVRRAAQVGMVETSDRAARLKTVRVRSEGT